MVEPLTVKGREPSSLVTGQIRTIRRQRKMTLEQVANATGLDKGYLSRIERGKTPSIAALLKIAAALGVQIGHLFGEQVDHATISVMRREDRKTFPGVFEGPGHRYEALILGNAGSGMEAFIVYPSQDRDESATHAGHEMIFVLRGTVEVGFVDRSVQLHEGDCIHFLGSLRHRISGGGDSAVLVVVTGEAA